MTTVVDVDRLEQARAEFHDLLRWLNAAAAGVFVAVDDLMEALEADPEFTPDEADLVDSVLRDAVAAIDQVTGELDDAAKSINGDVGSWRSTPQNVGD